MAAFELIVGVVGIAGTLFAVWSYADMKRKEAVEAEKAITFAHRLADAVSVVNAIGAQARVAASLSDRDETTKKELKHHLVTQLLTIQAAQENLVRIQATGQAWHFGVPGRYLEPDAGGQVPRDPEPG
jgi:hypothetical protein